MPRPANPRVRESLLDAGLTLFHSQGFNAVGIKEITDTAGVPKGSFYSYYSSKNAFVAAVLDHYWSGIIRDHGSLLSDETVPPMRRLGRFFGALTEDHAERGFALGCLIGNLALELSEEHEEARLRLVAILDHWSSLFAECLTQARDGGAMTAAPEATELASMIIESWEGAVMRGRVDRSRAPYDRFLSVSLPRLLGAVGASA
ncbi:TetR/AcrR family transcriptional repressor of nem operon [Streptomyces umbrinus]|uniref:TetR/AcrR family transcriptional regulator n=1 Tax=Streptomyces umbrinus TaxID=67370 RepID=UPI00167CE6C4|nr:TetR/AcrR family transcriptional regulator [Streptomyces umbrinus]MCR3731946.1 TetR/AcrR family transcriptional repressor of nem operon [Streptomyces umbrinus]GHH66540.1 TetR family transcriptional regulator [Streptomyces umbrinus]